MRSWIIVLSAVLAAGVAAVALADDTPATATEATFLKNTRQLTFEGNRAGEGYFSNDMKWFVYAAEREKDNPFYQIYLMSLESGDVTRVSPGFGKTTCAYFDPRAERVIFASSHLDPNAVQKQKDELEMRAAGKQRRYAWDYDETYEIFSTKYDGSDPVQLTNAMGYDAECAYSPDGQWIVFCSTRSAYPLEKLPKDEQERAKIDLSYFAEIYVMRADGSDVRRITDNPGYDGGPFFSPDGTRIIWRAFNKEGDIANVFTCKVDGSDRKQVTDFGSMSWAPYYHPTGEYIVFTSNKLGFSNFELFIVDTDGAKEPVRVTFTDGFDGLPIYSTDGKKLSWTTNRTPGKQTQIFIAEWNHEAAKAALSAAPARVPAATRAGGGGAPMMRSSKTQVAFSPEIRASDLKNDVSFLADDELEGRLTGSKGEKKAAEYATRRFRDMGLREIGEDGYYQSFPFTSGVKLVKGANKMVLKTGEKERSLELDRDFRPLAFSENASIEGPIAFVGYGLKTPGSGTPTGAPTDPYDSYGSFDAKDKIVLVLAYVPESAAMERKMHLNMYAGLRYKAMIAREHGAKALMVVTGPTSPNAGVLSKLGFDQSLSGSGIPVVSISGETADLLLQAAGKNLKEIQEQLDIENPHAESVFDIPGATVSIATKIEREMGKGRNVLAYLPAGTGDDATAPVIVLGAHFDHLGRGETNSMARKGEENQIHNGADDNASGTAVLMEMAHALSDLRAREPQRFPFGVVFALWSGEELGVIGSSHFMEHPTIPKERMAAYFNFDMVGRLKENTLMVQGTGSSEIWKGLVEKRNVAAGFNVKIEEDPYLPTDVTAFYPKGVPVLAFFTGSHEDYHRPTDDVETLDYDGMARIATFAMNILMDVQAKGEKPAYVKVERSKESAGTRANMRISLGTIPDYSPAEIEGLKISGVRGGGPADKAGLLGGDVIVELAGKAIKNIYDYTYAMDALKVGEPVAIVVVRGGEKVTLTITPEARQ